MYEKLRVYKEQHGHCRVKQHEDFKLSVWVHKNKEGKERLSIEKREKLGQLGFKWPSELFAETWELSAIENISRKWRSPLKNSAGPANGISNLMQGCEWNFNFSFNYKMQK